MRYWFEKWIKGCLGENVNLEYYRDSGDYKSTQTQYLYQAYMAGFKKANVPCGAKSSNATKS